MSLVGGYFQVNGKMSDDIINQKTESFDIIGSESRQSYRTIICKGCYGHIAAKFKVEAPIQVRYKSVQNWDVITLGFHDIDYGPEFYGGCAGNGRYDELSPSDPASQIEESEGEFVSLLLDKRSDKVHIINDRFGSRPFYILQSSEGFVFSSNMAFLVHLYGQRLSPDPLGWLQIFSYSHTLGERTNFVNVKRIRPASHVIISKNGLREKQYWKLEHEARDGLEPEKYVERVFGAFESSIRKRLAFFNKGFVSLSGGLDSRLATAAVPKEDDFYTFTFVDSVSDKDTIQVETAKEISRILGREHHVKSVSNTCVSDIADDVVKLTGGLVPIHHPCKAFQSILEMQRSSGFKMGGGPGDSLAGAFVSSSIHNINERLTDQQVRKFIVRRKKFSQETLSRIFRRDLVDQYFLKLDGSMRECFSRLSGPTAAHRTTAWAMVFRQPAFTFTSPIYTHPDVTEASPHLGYEYADLMLKLPASWIYQKNFYKFMIYHCLPDLRHVIYANTGAKLPDVLYKYKISNRKRICGAVEKLLPFDVLEYYRSTRRWAKRRAQSSFEYEMMKGDEILFSTLREILCSSGGLKDFFNLDGCMSFLDDYQAGRAFSDNFVNDAHLLGGLATACYWSKCVRSLF